MNRLVRFWRSESAMIISILLALTAAGLIPGTAGKIIGVVLPLLAGQAVRQTVFAPDTVAEKVEEAATAVAAKLTSSTVGSAGSVPQAAQKVVNRVVAGVLGK